MVVQVTVKILFEFRLREKLLINEIWTTYVFFVLICAGRICLAIYINSI